MFCYIAYTAFHYVVYRRTCRKHGITEMPYNAKAFFLISVVLVVVGLAAMSLYNYPLIRYAAILLIVMVGIIERKQIVEIVRQVKNKGEG